MNTQSYEVLDMGEGPLGMTNFLLIWVCKVLTLPNWRTKVYPKLVKMAILTGPMGKVVQFSYRVWRSFPTSSHGTRGQMIPMVLMSSSPSTHTALR